MNLNVDAGVKRTGIARMSLNADAGVERTKTTKCSRAKKNIR
jgi:hypothetical protein